MPALIAQRISAFGSLWRPIILPRFVAAYLHMRRRSPEKILINLNAAEKARPPCGGMAVSFPGRSDVQRRGNGPLQPFFN
jgi:hypothetical protein